MYAYFSILKKAYSIIMSKINVSLKFKKSGNNFFSILDLSKMEYRRDFSKNKDTVKVYVSDKLKTVTKTDIEYDCLLTKSKRCDRVYIAVSIDESDENRDESDENRDK